MAPLPGPASPTGPASSPDPAAPEQPAGHVPVLLERVVALLGPALARPGAVAVDATVGLGGHSEALLQHFPVLRLVGIDRDPEAVRRSRARLEPYGPRVSIVQAVDDDLPVVLADLGIPAVDGLLFDLGVSSLQLDEGRRGFAYAHDAPLDMRMDPAGPLTAADVLNTYAVDDLARVLRDYGEERYARAIAVRIVRARDQEPFVTSGRLVELIRAAIPAPARRTGGNPAKRTFQALRIEVNAELEVLAAALPASLRLLSLGGRVAILAYHSLEDRIVKRALAAGATVDLPAGLPVIPADRAPWLRLLTRGAERPDDAEVAANPRAASARLRAAERIRVAA